MNVSAHESAESLEAAEIAARLHTQQSIPSLCIWRDICGWGGVLDDFGWDLTSLSRSPKARILQDFYSIVGDPSFVSPPPSGSEKVLILNDGIAKAVDVVGGYLPDPVLFAFYLRDLVMHHYMARRTLMAFQVSLRTVAAGGARLQYTLSRKTGHSFLSYGDNISAQGRAILGETYVYYPLEFQMNTAFAKAFTIESMGSKAGIAVGGCYLEAEYMELVLSFYPGASLVGNRFCFGRCLEKPMVILNLSKEMLVGKGGTKFRVFQIMSGEITNHLESERTEFDLSVDGLHS